MVMGVLGVAGAQAAKKALTKKKSGGSSGGGKARKGVRRRRRARLTQGDIMELTNIKNILGKTAAANALPFYLGRGRG